MAHKSLAIDDLGEAAFDVGRKIVRMDKVELHCHLDGLIDAAMLAELVRRGVGAIDAAALTATIPVQSSAQWLEVYAPLVAPCMTPATFVPIIEIHIANLIRQHVVYAEVMVSGLLHSSEQEVIDRFRTLRDAADRAGGTALEIELLVAIGRGSVERAERQADRIVALAHARLIAGVAIAGDEGACTIASLAPVIARLRAAGLGIEIHAGETAGPASVWDALEHGRPDRLGHATTAFQDERLIDELVARGVHIEICPTSNLCLGVVASIAEHPVVRARDRGMNFSINTDDPGPFGCTLESEHALLERELGFTADVFDAIRANALRSRFRRPTGS